MNLTSFYCLNKTRSNTINFTQISLTSIVLTVVFVGFALNLSAAIYFSNIRARGNFIVLLLILSLIETMYGLSYFITQSFLFYTFLLEKTISTSLVANMGTQFIIHGLRNIYRVLLFSRNWMIAFIAWMRFEVIRQPLRSQTNSKRYMKWGLSTIIGIAVVLTLPKMLDCKIHVCDNGFVFLTRTKLASQQNFNYFFIPLHFFMQGAVPALIIMFCSVFLINEIHKRNEQFLDNHQMRASCPTKTVLILCVIFTVCEIPKSIMGIIYYINFYLKINRFRYILENAADIGNILSSMDSILNFAAYLYTEIKRRSVKVHDPMGTSSGLRGGTTSETVH